jgi:ABC-type uncharacterized transport system substrate-binding protein
VIGKAGPGTPFAVARAAGLRAAFAIGLVGMALVQPAAAHPHVWVTARTELIFDQSGLIKAVRNAWVFDEMYSAFATEGLGKNGKPPTPEELAPLAKTNIDSLAEFDDFTYAKEAGAKVAFGEPTDYVLEEREDKLVVLRFTLPLKVPARASKAFSLQIYDPTYFVAFSLDTTDPVTLVDAPKGCSANVLGANPLQAQETKKLSEAFFSGLSPGSDFGVKLADRIIVACP